MPTLEMIAKVREVILEDRRQTIHDVCNCIGLSYGSCQRILADELNIRRIAAKFVPSLLNNDQRDHRVQVCTVLQEAVRHDPNFLLPVQGHNWWWIVGVWLWPGNKAAVYAMEDTILSTTEKSAPSSQQHQIDADYFFWTFEELCIRSLYSLVRLSIGSFTARFWDDWGKMWGTNGLRCGRTETGCCTMTMRLHTPRSLWGNSSQKIMWPLFPTLPTHLTRPPAISTCFLKWNSGLMGDVSPPLKRSKQNRNRY